MKVNNYPVKTPESGDKLFGSDSSGDQVQFDMSNFSSTTYKVYTALLTQTSTNAPVAIVLENTIGNIVWARDTTGEYLATLLGAFTNNKTYLMINQTSSGENTFSVVDVDRLSLITYNSSGAAQDNKLNKTSIEIRVYN